MLQSSAEMSTTQSNASATPTTHYANLFDQSVSHTSSPHAHWSPVRRLPPCMNPVGAHMQKFPHQNRKLEGAYRVAAELRG